MALALAASLDERGELDEHDLMERFVSWRETGEYSATGTCFDIGITISSALRRFKASGNPVAGSTDPMSAGNGSLMRLAPVAIRYWNDARHAHECGGPAEPHDPWCARGGRCLRRLCRPHRRGHRRRTEGRSAARRAPTTYAGKVRSIMAGSWRGKHRDEIRGSGYVAHALEAALWCVGRTGSFAEAVVLAANLGEDADTTAAITGQLAGALYGANGIPEAGSTSSPGASGSSRLPGGSSTNQGPR